MLNTSWRRITGSEDAFVFVLGFLFATYLLWRGFAAWILAAREGDHERLQKCALVSEAVAAIALLASLNLDTTQRWGDWPWGWCIAFGAFDLVYRHSKREEKHVRRGSRKEFLREGLLDALEGVWILGNVILALAMFTAFFELRDFFSGKTKFQSLFSSIAFLTIGISLSWIAHKKLGFPRSQDEQIEAGSQAWIKENPARMVVARSLGLPEPPWSEDEISQLQWRLDEIQAEWDAQVGNRMAVHR